MEYQTHVCRTTWSIGAYIQCLLESLVLMVHLHLHPFQECIQIADLLLHCLHLINSAMWFDTEVKEDNRVAPSDFIARQ
jgi:hypothetical protein